MKIKSLFLVAFFVSCSMNSANAKFKISSTEIAPNSAIKSKHVFNGFGCTGENIFPKITWENVPANAKSLALTVYDPDAPTGSGWWHYVAINIPANYTTIAPEIAAQNKFNVNDGIRQIRNDFGTFSFGGPCPPVGHTAHRYIFTIYALKTDKIDIAENSTAALAGYMINQNVISKTSFTAFYKR